MADTFACLLLHGTIATLQMADNCGLAQWGGHMDVAHAASPNVTGPYVKLDTALPVQATNPQAIVDSTGAIHPTVIVGLPICKQLSPRFDIVHGRRPM